MATLEELLVELASQIESTLDGVTDVKVQVVAGWLLVPQPPAIDIYPADPSNDPDLAAFGDQIGGELITVRARVSAADIGAGQSLLLGFMDDEHELSIVNAITDPTLNGLADSIAFRGRSGYREFPDLSGEGVWLGALWSFVVVKARS